MVQDIQLLYFLLWKHNCLIKIYFVQAADLDDIFIAQGDLDLFDGIIAVSEDLVGFQRPGALVDNKVA